MAIINTIGSKGVNPRLWYGVDALWATGFYQTQTSGNVSPALCMSNVNDVRLHYNSNDLDFNSIDLEIFHYKSGAVSSDESRSFYFMPFIDFYIEPYEVENNVTPFPTVQVKAGERYELKYYAHHTYSTIPYFRIIRYDHTLTTSNVYGDSQVDYARGYVKLQARNYSGVGYFQPLKIRI